MACPRHVALRAKTMFLVHGLIPCLGEGLLRALPLAALLVLVQEGDGKDLLEVRKSNQKRSFTIYQPGARAFFVRRGCSTYTSLHVYLLQQCTLGRQATLKSSSRKYERSRVTCFTLPPPFLLLDPHLHLLVLCPGVWFSHQVTHVLNQLTIEYGPKSAQLLDGVLLPFIRRTYQLTPGAGFATAAAASAQGQGGGSGVSGAGGWSGIANGTPKLPGASSTAAGGAQASRDGSVVCGAGAEGAEAQQQQLLAHEVAERSGFQKLYFSVVQHLSSNGLAGVLSSPTNSSHLDGVLRSLLGGISGAEDASTKKTCLYIFSLLVGGFNRGRSGGVPPAGGAGAGCGGGTGKFSVNGSAGVAAGVAAAGSKATRAAATQRRGLSGKGGGLWTGSGPTVDMEPGVQVAVTAFVREQVVPAALKCLGDGAPTGLDLRDATAMSAVVHMGALLKEAKEASGGSAGFVGAAALACSCTPQVRDVVRASELVCGTVLWAGGGAGGLAERLPAFSCLLSDTCGRDVGGFFPRWLLVLPWFRGQRARLKFLRGLSSG